MNELHYLSATRALEMFRSHELSPTELLRATLERVDRVEPVINAFTERLEDVALREAAESERRYLRGDPRPLEGLPVAAKEEQSIAGRESTDGTLLRPPVLAKTTAIALSRIRAAGGILHARTTTSEFCCMPAAHTHRWGTTRNPWNHSTSPGGSSGGSAASLAAGTAILATGSDIGGSLRTPASLTGTVAFKAPHGRIPVLAPAGQDRYFHHGPMARTVADVALLQRVMAGPDPRDSHSLIPAAPAAPLALESRGLRVALCASPGDFPVDSEVRENTLAAGAALTLAGVEVEQVEVGWVLEDIKHTLWAHFGTGLAKELLELDRERPGVITGYALDYARKGVENATRTDADTEARLTASMQTQLDRALEGFDALVLPTMGATGLAAGEDYVERPLMVEGRALEHFSDASLTPIFNVCSTHPVVALPSGWATNGVPTGVQVVTAHFADDTALRVASMIEAALDAGFYTRRTPPDPMGSRW